jgi:CO/xanthine dehydrogenase FAD-binding subunit
MPKKPSGYYRPQTLEEALSLLARPDTVPLAGGTTLLAGDVNGAVVDLQELGLSQVKMVGGRLVVGAMARLVEMAAYLEENGRPGDPAALLLAAIGQAGPNTFRNAATVGGVIGGRPADSELLAALLVLEAELRLQWAGVEPFALSLADYLGAGERPVGLITEIGLAWEEGKGASERVARTPADYPIVAVTGWRPEGGMIRLAATGISARPVQLGAVEAVLREGGAQGPRLAGMQANSGNSEELKKGEELSIVNGQLSIVNEEVIEQAGAVARDSSVHPGDFRGDAAYRAEMAAVLVRRVLRQLV